MAAKESKTENEKDLDRQVILKYQVIPCKSLVFNKRAGRCTIRVLTFEMRASVYRQDLSSCPTEGQASVLQKMKFLSAKLDQPVTVYL